MYEFDLKTLFKALLGAKKLILINCSIAFIVAVIIAFSIPKVYSASASLVPEAQDENKMGGLSSLASMAGINMPNSSSAIVPDLYPDVVSSNTFLIDLLYVDVVGDDGNIKTNYLTYLSEYNKQPWWNVILGWPVQMVDRLFPDEDEISVSSQGGRINPARMSRKENGLVKAIRNNVGCMVDEDSKVITLSFRSQDPVIAATMVDSLKQHLQKFITEYQTSKARVDLEYYKKLAAEAKVKYNVAQTNYATYCDSHKGAILQAYISEQESLENELQLAYTAYSQMCQQVQMAEAKVQERTPAFTQIEGASVPNQPDSPKKKLIVIALVFITFVFTVAWVYIKLLFFHEHKA